MGLDNSNFIDEETDRNTTILSSYQQLSGRKHRDMPSSAAFIPLSGLFMREALPMTVQTFCACGSQMR